MSPPLIGGELEVRLVDERCRRKRSTFAVAESAVGDVAKLPIRAGDDQIDRLAASLGSSVRAGDVVFELDSSIHRVSTGMWATAGSPVSGPNIWRRGLKRQTHLLTREKQCQTFLTCASRRWYW